METGGLANNIASIDWTQPWLSLLRPLRDGIESANWRDALSAHARTRNIANANGRQIAFVAPDDAPAGTAYEAHIAATGRVPTRDVADGGWHDVFNALMWLTFPRLKAALNVRQAAEIAQRGVGATRGPVRDAATLIDESAVLIACTDAAWFDALAAHDWQAALIDARPRWGRDIHAYAFGHALVEKLNAPYKGITAAVVPLRICSDVIADIADIDAAAAEFVLQDTLAPALLPHLPVLGIPGWWPANADPAFYADAKVFRPQRTDRANRANRANRAVRPEQQPKAVA